MYAGGNVRVNENGSGQSRLGWPAFVICAIWKLFPSRHRSRCRDSSSCTAVRAGTHRSGPCEHGTRDRPWGRACGPLPCSWGVLLSLWLVFKMSRWEIQNVEHKNKANTPRCEMSDRRVLKRNQADSLREYNAVAVSDFKRAKATESYRAVQSWPRVYTRRDDR